MNGQKDESNDRLIDTGIKRLIEKWADRYMNGQIDECNYRCMNRKRDRQMDRRKYHQVITKN